MAPKKLYAWTDIRYSGDAGERLLLKCGREVNPAALKLSDNAVAELVRTKAIRTIPYPVPPSPNAISPTSHFKKLAKAIEDGADDSMLEGVLPDIYDDSKSVNPPKSSEPAITTLPA